jgi:hypothetical protein
MPNILLLRKAESYIETMDMNENKPYSFPKKVQPVKFCFTAFSINTPLDEF